MRWRKEIRGDARVLMPLAAISGGRVKSSSLFRRGVPSESRVMRKVNWVLYHHAQVLPYYSSRDALAKAAVSGWAPTAWGADFCRLQSPSHAKPNGLIRTKSAMAARRSRRYGFHLAPRWHQSARASPLPGSRVSATLHSCDVGYSRASEGDPRGELRPSTLNFKALL